MTSTDRSYFEEMYREESDPWGFETSPYERRKYALTIASLPRERYASAYEPGCSIGVLTEMLAQRCDRLLSTDIIPAAVQRASERLATAPHVSVEVRTTPEQWPTETFDLIVLSEVAYYFARSDLAILMERVIGSTRPGANVVAVHWRGKTDYPLTGDCAHALIGSTSGLSQVVHHSEIKFLLDIWERQS